ncbi:hypothetical protein NE237_017074 [Protea cynaroides]|uniref:Uncharacterized protein n=1 Tax=Protea cynaroides TaxID=273540 RepID=A0A9Q0K7C7_9MAGN|nr:hypothetical protein NE237_017074 [Protea cynaroides]
MESQIGSVIKRGHRETFKNFLFLAFKYSLSKTTDIHPCLAFKPFKIFFSFLFLASKLMPVPPDFAADASLALLSLYRNRSHSRLAGSSHFRECIWTRGCYTQ